MLFRGDRLRELREKKGLSQEDLAKLVGTTQQYISSFEKETHGRVPGTKLLTQLAAVLGCSLDYLMDLSPLPNPDLAEHERRLIIWLRAHGNGQTVDEIILMMAEADAAKRRQSRRKR